MGEYHGVKMGVTCRTYREDKFIIARKLEDCQLHENNLVLGVNFMELSPS
jgi:hypothetical protein